MKKEINQDKKMTPVAYLPDLSGVKFIVKINDKKDHFAFMVPPKYKIHKRRCPDGRSRSP